MSKVILERTKQVVVSELEICKSLFQRLKGLMGRPSLPQGHGTLITKSYNSIHTFFMRFSIDLIFVDGKGCVHFVSPSVKPWRMVIAPTAKARDCLEVPAGTAEQFGIVKGDVLRVEA